MERIAEKDGKLSMTEVQYMDTLAHAKKNLLKGEEMMGESEYSGRMVYDNGGMYGGRSYNDRSYARKRDSMGRYSRSYSRNNPGGYSRTGMVDELRRLMNDAPDDRTRMEFQSFIDKMEQM